MLIHEARRVELIVAKGASRLLVVDQVGYSALVVNLAQYWTVTTFSWAVVRNIIILGKHRL